MPSVRLEGPAVVKSYGPEDAGLYRNALRFHRLLEAAALAPVLLDSGREGPGWFMATAPWVRVDDHPREERPLWRARVLSAVLRMHAAGVAHRDLHAGNVVTRGREVLFIDLDLACVADPRRPCYDLHGPGESGVEVPEQHAAQGVAIWWDTNQHAQALHRRFGPLSGTA